MTGEELRQRRLALGLMQEDLAREIGVRGMTVSRWERGIYPIPEAIGLALEALEHRATKQRGEIPA